MLTRAHLILLVVTIAGPAYAKSINHATPHRVVRPRDTPPPEATAEIAVGAPADPQVSIARAVTDVREVGETAVITMTLELAAQDDLHTGRITLTLPRDASVVGLTFARNHEMLTAVARDAVGAEQAFEQTRVVKRDPALLERTERSDLRLSLYPVTVGEHPTATLTITMPRFHRLLVDVAGTRHEVNSSTFAPATGDEIALAHREPAMTAGMSLLAMPPPSLDDIDLRVQNNPAAIHTCSMLADRDGPLDITLTIVIGASGDVTEASAGDTAVGECAARLASAWRFGPGERPIAMHYRLHLTPG